MGTVAASAVGAGSLADSSIAYVGGSTTPLDLVGAGTAVMGASGPGTFGTPNTLGTGGQLAQAVAPMGTAPQASLTSGGGAGTLADVLMQLQGLMSQLMSLVQALQGLQSLQDPTRGTTAGGALLPGASANVDAPVCTCTGCTCSSDALAGAAVAGSGPVQSPLQVPPGGLPPVKTPPTQSPPTQSPPTQSPPTQTPPTQTTPGEEPPPPPPVEHTPGVSQGDPGRSPDAVHVMQVYHPKYLKGGPQRSMDCGPASVVIALRAAGIDSLGGPGDNQAKFIKQARTKGGIGHSGGTTTAELAAIVKGAGGKVTYSGRNFEQLTGNLKSKDQPIVMIGNPGDNLHKGRSGIAGGAYHDLHWVAVTEYDPERNMYAVNDPLSTKGTYWVDEKTLRKYHNSSNVSSLTVGMK